MPFVKTRSIQALLAGTVWAAVLAVSLLSCSEPKPYVVTDYEVTLKPEGPVPKSIDVLEGRKVVWINKDTLTHTLKSGAPEDPMDFFTVGPIPPGESTSITLDSLGSFPYYSTRMPETYFGIIVVLEDTVVNEERLEIDE